MVYINQTLHILPEQELHNRICTRFYTTLGKQKIADLLTSRSTEYPRVSLFPKPTLNIVGACDRALETVTAASSAAERQRSVPNAISAGYFPQHSAL